MNLCICIYHMCMHMYVHNMCMHMYSTACMAAHCLVCMHTLCRYVCIHIHWYLLSVSPVSIQTPWKQEPCLYLCWKVKRRLIIGADVFKNLSSTYLFFFSVCLVICIRRDVLFPDYFCKCVMWPSCITAERPVILTGWCNRSFFEKLTNTNTSSEKTYWQTKCYLKTQDFML